MKPITKPLESASLVLYGGSFDPVHFAHLQMARSVIEQMGPSKVIFIPAARSPLKPNSSIASDANRIKMLHLATADEPGFEVDDCEIQRGGISYTVDTVSMFRARYPNAKIHWIIGADQIKQLHRWHRIREITADLTFIILRRPGHLIYDPLIPGLQFVELITPMMPHSSSAIRKALVNGHGCAELVPTAVEAFISEQRLYI